MSSRPFSLKPMFTVQIVKQWSGISGLSLAAHRLISSRPKKYKKHTRTASPAQARSKPESNLTKPLVVVGQLILLSSFLICYKSASGFANSVQVLIQRLRSVSGQFASVSTVVRQKTDTGELASKFRPARAASTKELRNSTEGWARASFICLLTTGESPVSACRIGRANSRSKFWYPALV